MNKEARNAAIMRYNEKATKQIKFSFNLKTDADIIEKLESVGNKQGYIKELIRKDLKN